MPSVSFQLPTPALVVDLDAFDRNIAHANALVEGKSAILRPHFKTHRTPTLALRQLGPFAKGLTCATVGEADVLVSAGVTDVLIANEVVTPDKLGRVAQLASRAHLIIAVEAVEGVDALSRAAQSSGTVVDVLIDLDIGLHRCGVRDLEAACTLAAAIERASGVRLAGLMGYEGRIRAKDAQRSEKIAQAYARLAEAKTALEKAGFLVEIVSAGGTATLVEALNHPTITEVQAGTYVLMEPDVADLNLPFECAVYVVGSVISTSSDQVVLDVGRRSIGYDYGLPHVLGETAVVKALNDEHAVLSWQGSLPSLGQQVWLRPTQARTTFNLHDIVWAASDDRIVDVYPITARGKS